MDIIDEGSTLQRNVTIYEYAILWNLREDGYGRTIYIYIYIYIYTGSLTSTDEIVKQLTSVINDSANDILGKYRQKKQRWITDELLDMCDLRIKLKKNKFDTGSTR